MANKKFSLASLLSNLDFRLTLLKAELVESIRSVVENNTVELSVEIKVSINDDRVPMNVVSVDKDNVYSDGGSEYSLTELSADDLNKVAAQVFADAYPDEEKEVA